MKEFSKTLKTGTRSSNLALIQTKNACNKTSELLPFIKFELYKFSTPGDRDKKTDLKISSDDFFSKDLDNAILENRIDCAIHSAKDLPYPVRKGLDWFWLPWNEDARDAIIVNNPNNISKKIPVIGISSERREKYALKRWPNCRIKAIRGNIEERLKQLDNGKYDILIMAAAALVRLGMQNRIFEYIPLKDLTPPEGQGYLAITFNENNQLFKDIRKYFVKSAVFAGAGPGNPDMVTMETIKALNNCDICLYDALIPSELLTHLSSSAKQIFVGKRSGKHSLVQPEINKLISTYSRQGKKVVRLKGGDPGVFGRLSEETETLNKLQLPYRVVPGITSITAATSSTGLLLTKRDISRGFTVATCRQKGSKGFVPAEEAEVKDFTKVFMMSITFLPNLVEYLISNDVSTGTPVSVVFSAGCPDEIIVSSPLKTIKEKIAAINTSAPGIVIVGKSANSKYLYKKNGVFAGKKVLLTCSEKLALKGAEIVFNYGGLPIIKPMIKLEPNYNNGEILKNTINTYDWFIITSPGSVNCLMKIVEKHSIDIRTIPKIIVCGTGTAEELKKYGICADAIANDNFGSTGLIDTLKKTVPDNSKILRIKSNLAPNKITETLRRKSYNVDDIELYTNEKIKYSTIPEFDIVVFASSSAIANFIESFGSEILSGKSAIVIGTPTQKALESHKVNCNVVLSKEATIKSCIDTIALELIKDKIIKDSV